MVEAKLPVNPFGRTGRDTSILGLAALPMRGVAPKAPGLTPEDVERAFLEHGVTTFLVSPRMRSQLEGLRRLIAAGHRDALTIMGIPGMPSRWSVRHNWRRTTRALGTDYLDVFLFGWVRREWHLRYTWKTFQALKSEGKIRAIGFSCHNRKMATRLGVELDVDVLMIRYNAAHRGAEKDNFEPLGTDRPGIISYTSTRWGTLLRPLPEQGFDNGMTADECYRFAAHHPSVDVTLFAPRTGDELDEDVAGVLQGELSEERLTEIRSFGDAVHASAKGAYRFMFR